MSKKINETPEGRKKRLANLKKNVTNYRYNYKYEDATEITLHFINIKY